MNCITDLNGKQIGIYKITNLSNEKCYIGQSIELEKRYRSHRNSLRTDKHPNNHLQNAYNKGDKFIFEVIELCSVNELDNREILWIDFFDSTNRVNGYNFETGGNVNRERHPETLLKMSNIMKKHFSDEKNRIKSSIKKTTISLKTVRRIKETLRFTDSDRNIIAEQFAVSEHIVAHICQIDSHYYICDKYNIYLKNRQENIDAKKNRLAINLYREGRTYDEIGKALKLHARNAIRRVQAIKTVHDDRCRLNAINRAISKRSSLIKTLNVMGKNTVEISKLLKTSRSTVSKVVSGQGMVTFSDINDTRGKPKEFKYKANKADSFAIIQDGTQLAFVI